MATSRVRFDELRRVKREDEYGSDEDAHVDDGDEDEPEIGRLEFLVRAVVAGVKHYLPQLVLVAILIPCLLVVSFVAGWLVKSSIPIGVEERVFMRYGEGPMPQGDILLPPLVADQAYEVSVRLTVPHSGSNVALGNFMTYLTIVTPSNKTLASSSTPSLLLPPPQPPFLLKFLPLPSFLRQPQHTTLFLTPLPTFTPYTSTHLHATVRVGRLDAWSPLTPGQLARELTIIDAHLVLRTRLEGTRKVIGSYPRTSGLLSAGMFFIVSVAGMLVCFWRFTAPFDASAGMHGRRMRGLGGVGSLGGLGGVGGGRASALAGIGLAAEKLRTLEHSRPARFSERMERDREREVELAIAREAEAIKKEEEASTVPSEEPFTSVGDQFASGSGLRARRGFADGEPSTEDDELGTEGDGESSPDMI